MRNFVGADFPWYETAKAQMMMWMRKIYSQRADLNLVSFAISHTSSTRCQYEVAFNGGVGRWCAEMGETICTFNFSL